MLTQISKLKREIKATSNFKPWVSAVNRQTSNPAASLLRSRLLGCHENSCEGDYPAAHSAHRFKARQVSY